MSLPNTHSHITIHARWFAAPGGDLLTPQTWERLPSYITRYAQTLGVAVHAVGGTEDHAHLLLDLPAGKSLDSITSELQKAAARFLKDTLNLRDFAWDRTADFAESVSRSEVEALRVYVLANAEHHADGAVVPSWEAGDTELIEEPNAIPAWLRAAMPTSEG